MNEFIMACGSCFIAGFLTTIHPCPLTTNIASISFLSGLTANRKKTASVVSFFVAGYLIAYLFLGIVISSGLLSISSLSIRLQRSINLFLGPVLIFTGMLQAKFIHLPPLFKGKIMKYLQSRKWQGIEGLPFGILVALSFCPATAAIFFGILIPLAVKYEQMILFPLIYALGASMPVIATSILISRGTMLTARSKWVNILPVISGWVLIIAGIFISIKIIYLA